MASTVASSGATLQLRTQQRGRILLDQDLRLEVQPGGEAEVLVRRAGVAVRASVLAATVRVDAASKPTSGLWLRAMMVRVVSRKKCVRGAGSAGSRASGSGSKASGSNRFGGLSAVPRPRIWIGCMAPRVRRAPLRSGARVFGLFSVS
jgi:hypothetical protein